MINHLFGNNNLKSANELRLVGKRKKATNKETSGANRTRMQGSVDHWGTDAKEALRVPVLAKDHAAHLKDSTGSLPAFGSKASNKFALSVVNPYGIESNDEGECSRESASLTSSGDALKRFGFYTQSAEYGARMKTILKKHNVDICYFDPDSPVSEDEISKHVAWIVDLSDEHECQTLDVVMDRCNEVPALFLFDHNITPNILDKLSDFIAEK